MIFLQVSILVLVDLAFEFVEIEDTEENEAVSILVLVDLAFEWVTQEHTQKLV